MSGKKESVFISAQIMLTGSCKSIEDRLVDIEKPRGFKYDIEGLADDVGLAILVEETEHYQKFSVVLGEFLTALSALSRDGTVSVIQVAVLLRSDVVSAFLVPSSLASALSDLDSPLFISIEPANGNGNINGGQANCRGERIVV